MKLILTRNNTDLRLLKIIETISICLKLNAIKKSDDNNICERLTEINNLLSHPIPSMRADVNARFEQGSLLHIAVRIGYLPLIKTLLMHGADIFQVDTNLVSPLSMLVDATFSVRDKSEIFDLFINYQSQNSIENVIYLLHLYANNFNMRTNRDIEIKNQKLLDFLICNLTGFDIRLYTTTSNALKYQTHLHEYRLFSFVSKGGSPEQAQLIQAFQEFVKNVQESWNHTPFLLLRIKFLFEITSKLIAGALDYEVSKGLGNFNRQVVVDFLINELASEIETLRILEFSNIISSAFSHTNNEEETRQAIQNRYSKAICNRIYNLKPNEIISIVSGSTDHAIYINFINSLKHESKILVRIDNLGALSSIHPGEGTKKSPYVLLLNIENFNGRNETVMEYLRGILFTSRLKPHQESASFIYNDDFFNLDEPNSQQPYSVEPQQVIGNCVYKSQAVGLKIRCSENVNEAFYEWLLDEEAKYISTSLRYYKDLASHAFNWLQQPNEFTSRYYEALSDYSDVFYKKHVQSLRIDKPGYVAIYQTYLNDICSLSKLILRECIYHTAAAFIINLLGSLTQIIQHFHSPMKVFPAIPNKNTIQVIKEKIGDIIDENLLYEGISILEKHVEKYDKLEDICRVKSIYNTLQKTLSAIEHNDSYLKFQAYWKQVEQLTNLSSVAETECEEKLQKLKDHLSEFSNSHQCYSFLQAVVCQRLADFEDKDIKAKNHYYSESRRIMETISSGNCNIFLKINLEYQKGVLLHKLNEFDSAEHHLLQALKLHEIRKELISFDEMVVVQELPTKKDILTSLTFLYLDMQKFDEARAVFNFNNRTDFPSYNKDENSIVLDLITYSGFLIQKKLLLADDESDITEEKIRNLESLANQLKKIDRGLTKFHLNELRSEMCVRNILHQQIKTRKRHRSSIIMKMDVVSNRSNNQVLDEQLKNWSLGKSLNKASWKFLLPDEDIQMQWVLSASKEEKHSAKTITQRKEKMINAAKKYGYTCQDAEEDGDCFFHVIANQLNRLGREASDDIDHEVLRTLVAVEVAEHSHYYKDFLAVSEQERYAQKIAEPRVWVGMIAAQAIARIKHVIVVIIPNDGGMPQVMKPPGATEVIVLGNEVGVHFQSLYSETYRAGIPTEALRNIIEATPELTVTQGVITVEQTTRNVAEIMTGTTTTTLLTTLSDSHLAVTAKSTVTPMDIEANKEGNEEEVTTKGPIAPLTSSELSAPTTRKRTRNPEEDTHQAAEPSEQTQTKRAKLG